MSKDFTLILLMVGFILKLGLFMNNFFTKMACVAQQVAGFNAPSGKEEGHNRDPVKARKYPKRSRG